jgi:hypothetical protein
VEIINNKYFAPINILRFDPKRISQLVQIRKIIGSLLLIKVRFYISGIVILLGNFGWIGIRANSFRKPPLLSTKSDDTGGSITYKSQILAMIGSKTLF